MPPNNSHLLLCCDLPPSTNELFNKLKITKPVRYEIHLTNFTIYATNNLIQAYFLNTPQPSTQKTPSSGENGVKPQQPRQKTTPAPVRGNPQSH